MTLCWIIYALRPLKAKEIDHALGVLPEILSSMRLASKIFTITYLSALAL